MKPFLVCDVKRLISLMILFTEITMQFISFHFFCTSQKVVIILWVKDVQLSRFSTLFPTANSQLYPCYSIIYTNRKAIMPSKEKKSMANLATHLNMLLDAILLPCHSMLFSECKVCSPASTPKYIMFILIKTNKQFNVWILFFKCLKRGDVSINLFTIITN